MNTEYSRLIRAIMINIANEDDPHGHFLTYFAKAYVNADSQNEEILLPIATRLVTKYDLERKQRSRGILCEDQYKEVQ